MTPDFQSGDDRFESGTRYYQCMDTKVCGRCKQEKPVGDFHKSSRKGYQSYCKSCSKEHKTEWLEGNRDKVRWNQIWTRYRLRKEDFDQLLSDQDGRCAICDEVMSDPQIDHDHETKEVRGLLCKKCNLFVGWIEVHGSLLDRLNEYLIN